MFLIIMPILQLWFAIKQLEVTLIPQHVVKDLSQPTNEPANTLCLHNEMQREYNTLLAYQDEITTTVESSRRLYNRQNGGKIRKIKDLSRNVDSEAQCLPLNPYFIYCSTKMMLSNVLCKTSMQHGILSPCGFINLRPRQITPTSSLL